MHARIIYKHAVLKSVKTESNIYSIISCIYKSLYALHPNGNQQTPSHHTSIGFWFAILKGDKNGNNHKSIFRCIILKSVIILVIHEFYVWLLTSH